MNPPTSNSPPDRPRSRTRLAADASGSSAYGLPDLPDLSDVPAGSEAERLGVDLAREMRRRWRAGGRLAAEEFLSGCPELWDRPEAAIEVIYEEFCLRQAAGDD